MPFRVVLDTNILLRGLLNGRSAAGGVVDACDRRAVVILLNRPTLQEYRQVLTDAAIVERYPELTSEKVEVALRRLRFEGDWITTVKTQFEFPRDPRDAKFIELAIAGKATHIVSGDKDLLSLPVGYGDASTRFRQRCPSVGVVSAATLLNLIEMS